MGSEGLEMAWVTEMRERALETWTRRIAHGYDVQLTLPEEMFDPIACFTVEGHRQSVLVTSRRENPGEQISQ